MSFKYFPHTEADLQAMMQKVGVSDLDGLYAELPEEVRFRGDYNLPEGMSEVEVRQLFDQLGRQNQPLTCFAGAGVYDHYTPSVIPNLLQRSEFLTSYTPYQAEISQGTLHYIFEFQSMMAELTGMDISNASMYDGTTASAEAMMMAVAAGKKQRRFLVSETVDPKTVEVMKTYAHFQGIDLEIIPQKDGTTDRDAMVQNRNESFLSFYHHFATDSIFQVESLDEPVATIMPDPEDDFTMIDGEFYPEQWEEFRPPVLPSEMIYNIIYGQTYEESTQKVFVIRGISNGLETEMTFRRKDGKWKLVKIVN